MTNYGMTQKNVFLSIHGFLSLSHIKGCRNHIISKDIEMLRNYHYNLCVHSRLHIDTLVVTIHVGKIVELWCFGCDSIAISEAYEVSFFITFFVNFPPPSWVRYFLNCSFEVHLEPCQTSKMEFLRKHLMALRR